MKFPISGQTPLAGAPSRLVSLVLGFLVLIPVCVLAVAPGDPPDNASVSSVHIGVLGLFHSSQFKVSPTSGSALVLHAGEESIVLEKSSGIDSASVRLTETGVVLISGTSIVRLATLTVTGRKNEPVDFVLSVPEKITRRYHGTLEIKPSDGILIAVVAMDREAAVASVVAAENAADTPIEALKAQAVATRSYFVAAGRLHRNFDFCDTTHCQFLREPPAPGSAVAKAVAATRDLVLAFDSQPFAAMYTRSCSGLTRTPAELGLLPANYPYYSVACKYCRAHPVRWSSRIPASDSAVLRSSDESARLKLDRHLGWGTVPSNDFIVRKKNNQMVLEGTGMGHGIGLCQSGAKAMAEEGAGFRQILNHYYPNSAIVSSPREASSVRQAGR